MDTPIGDSAALRSHGAILRAAAEDLGRVADHIGHRTEAVEFHGPAADRFRAQMAERNLRLRHVARELADVADIVAQAHAQNAR